MDKPETATADTATPAAVATKPAVPRAPKLMVSIAGAAAISLLKYPFPTKAPTFFVKVNGEECYAANTGGRGKQYTYFKVKGTSFYVPGAYPADTEFKVDFPADYVFEDTGDRKSYYKPKKPAATANETTEAKPGGDVASAEVATDGVSPETPSTSAEVETPPAPSAKRRGK